MADFVLVRHGESVFNTKNLLNGDPTVDNPLSELGRTQASDLSWTLGKMQWGSVWTSRFPRTKETLHLISPELSPRSTELPLLDDINAGVFDSKHINEFRKWRHEHGPDAIPEGGESMVQAIERYSKGLLYLLANAERPALVITHDQPIRYVMNAQAGDDPLKGALRKVPNAVPYPFSAAALTLAARRLDERGGE